MRKSLLPLACSTLLLVACEPKPPVDPLPVVDTTATKGKDQALELNQVRAKYDECIRKLGPKAPACQDLQWMYDDVREQYDAARTKPAGN